MSETNLHDSTTSNRTNITTFRNIDNSSASRPPVYLLRLLHPFTISRMQRDHFSSLATITMVMHMRLSLSRRVISYPRSTRKMGHKRDFPWPFESEFSAAVSIDNKSITFSLTELRLVSRNVNHALASESTFHAGSKHQCARYVSRAVAFCTSDLLLVIVPLIARRFVCLQIVISRVLEENAGIFIIS